MFPDLKTLQALHKSGQLDAAKAGYLALLKKNPHEIEILHALGIICTQQENFAEATEYLQTAIQHEPNDSTLYLHLANILKIQGLFNQAVELLHRCIELNPDYAQAYNNLGTVYFAQNKFPDAIRTYNTAIEKQPNYIDAYYNLGLALTKESKLNKASEIYEKILNLVPEHFSARFQLARILMQEDKTDKAITHFIEIEKNHPDHLETQINLATCYVKKNLLSKAKSHYLSALEITPNDTQTLFNLGVICMQQGYIDSAIRYYQRAIQINADYFEAHNNAGVAFLAKQHVGFALHHFQEALRLQPNNKAIRHTVDMLSKNQHLLTSPPDYITSLFDAYADHYETHLLQALDYHVPELLFSALEAVIKPLKTTWDILDIGCGTGLCGIPFKPFAKKLIGIDLSEKMLAVAATKNIYDELITRDFTTFLADKKAAYDLILAGDVFVYIGDLDAIFSHVKSALKNQGLFIFNAEINEEKEYLMHQSGRFSHTKNYLDALAKKYSFDTLHYQTAVTRMQNNEPVLGHVYVLRVLW